jgi:hypothetical protein
MMSPVLSQKLSRREANTEDITNCRLCPHDVATHSAPPLHDVSTDVPLKAKAGVNAGP